MNLKQAILSLKGSISTDYTSSKPLVSVIEALEDAQRKMNALFEVASGGYHGNEGNKENEIDEILFEASQVLDRPYIRFSEDSE